MTTQTTAARHASISEDLAASVARRARYATQNAEAARKALAESATTETAFTNLAHGVNTVADAEGFRDVYAQAADGIERGITLVNLAKMVSTLGSRDADDGWSGRTNDSRRAYRDGVTRAVRDLMTEVFHEISKTA